jgi:F-type H+-transporting ATPase subunit b
MLFDWFTALAQLVNFVILIWLLERFLYRPILDAIDAREARVAKELADAAAKQVEALAERNEFQRKNEQFDQQRAALMNQATNDASTERQRLFEEARKAAEAVGARRMEALRTDGQRLNRTITRRAQQEVFAIAEKVLKDLASSNLQERAVAVFLNRIRGLDGQSKELLSQAIQSSTEPLLIRSAFELSSESQAQLESAIREIFQSQAPIRFETAPELISGLELRSNGQQLDWSIADYLEALQASVGELFDSQPSAQSRPVAKASA